MDNEIEHVLKITAHIKASDEQDKESVFAEKYKTFKTKYPQLYKKVCTEKDFDMDNLRFMLQMVYQINNKEKEQYNAEVLVGQMLFDKYIKPNVQS